MASELELEEASIEAAISLEIIRDLQTDRMTAGHVFTLFGHAGNASKHETEQEHV